MNPPNITIPNVDTVAAHDPDSPMTGDQADLLRVLCENASQPFDSSLSQSQALARIEDLRRELNVDQNL